MTSLPAARWRFRVQTFVDDVTRECLAAIPGTPHPIRPGAWRGNWQTLIKRRGKLDMIVFGQWDRVHLERHVRLGAEATGSSGVSLHQTKADAEWLLREFQQGAMPATSFSTKKPVPRPRHTRTKITIWVDDYNQRRQHSAAKTHHLQAAYAANLTHNTRSSPRPGQLRRSHAPPAAPRRKTMQGSHRRRMSDFVGGQPRPRGKRPLHGIWRIEEQRDADRALGQWVFVVGEVEALDFAERSFGGLRALETRCCREARTSINLRRFQRWPLARVSSITDEVRRDNGFQGDRTSGDLEPSPSDNEIASIPNASARRTRRRPCTTTFTPVMGVGGGIHVPNTNDSSWRHLPAQRLF